MPPLELLERAAASLGMTTSRDGTSLRVLLVGAIAVCITEEKGRTRQRLDFGGVPAWVWKASSAVVFAATTVIFLANPFTRVMAVLVFLAVWGLVTERLLSARLERLQERLFDRAYDMGKSAQA